MKLTALNITLLYLLLCKGSSLGDMVRRKDGHPMQYDILPTATSAALSSTPTHNSATFATPITTALPNHKVPLYIPKIGPLDAADIIKVDYWGPGNGGSSVYQVVMSAQATAAPVVTATLIEDETNAELIGGQRVMTIDGKEREVYGAASCGFADGLKNDHQSKTAGYCVYWYVADHVTSTWTNAVTQISAQTSIMPTSKARDQVPTQVNDDAQDSINSSADRIAPYAGLIATATVIALTIHLLRSWSI